MSRRRRSHRSDGRPPFLRREVGGAPYWFIIAALATIALIGIYVLVKMV